MLIFTVVPEPETKFVPAKVTVTVVPLNPLDGEIDVIVGVGRPTLNFTALLAPKEFETVTSCEAAGASGATLNVAVIVSFEIDCPLIVTPAPVIAMFVVPSAQPFPPETTNPLPLKVT